MTPDEQALKRMNMARLQALTEQLPPLLGDLVASNVKGCVEYKVNGGTCLGMPMFSQPEAAVQRSFMSKGSLFPLHHHGPCREILVVSRGRLRVTLTDGLPTKQGDTPTPDTVKELGPGDIAYFDHDQLHSVEALDDTWLFGITVPRAEGYPGEYAADAATKAVERG